MRDSNLRLGEYSGDKNKAIKLEYCLLDYWSIQDRSTLTELMNEEMQHMKYGEEKIDSRCSND